ncbi:YjeF N-terminal domain-like protein [Lichtheimia hyalospora FSU 10163]|nr:YjeF N-terminal domain-like protein [Lichtheimia hyalospora FSU 10163]
MAEAFLGLVISLQLHSGLKLTGTVAHIEPTTQQMTLKEAQLLFPGQPPHFTSVYGVSGKDIADLQVVSKPMSNQQVEPSKTATTNGSSKKQHTLTATQERVSNENNQRTRQKKNNRASSGRKQARAQPNGKGVSSNGWADEDVDGFKEKEFDFQANLSMFDKEKVFAEIRELDETAPETLLVTLNRLPRKPDAARTKLLPTENVLDNERESIGEESDTESSTTDERKHVNGNHKHLAPSIRTLDTHISCIPVSPLQMAHAEHECIKTGPSEVQLIENGGRGVCALTLQLIGGSRRIQSDDIPVIIMLTGNNKIGAYGMAAARHLINHGCHVVVCASEQRQGLGDAIAQQEAMLEHVGGKIVYDIQELSQWSADLIVDAMVGSQHNVLENDDDQQEYESLCKMIQWASKQSSPVLSIDFPSALGEDREYCIHPQWTVCLGAPKTGCLSSQVTGALYIVDIGIPKTCWKRAGVKGWSAPWGADFVVALEYAC